MMTKKMAVAIRHVHFEDLGTFAEPLSAAGFTIEYRDVGNADYLSFDPLEPDLVVVLGGPIGVYEDAAYPFVADEIAMLQTRLAADRPTLGLCLGAQLIARALGARVYSSGIKEIGFRRCVSPLQASPHRSATWPTFPSCTGTATPTTCRPVQTCWHRRRRSSSRLSDAGATSSPCSSIRRLKPARPSNAGWSAMPANCQPRG